MSKQPKTKLRNPTVKEVSLVPRGDNPPARVVLYKRAPDGKPSLAQRFREGLAAMAKALGRDPGPEIAKQLYDDVRQRQQASQVYGALMDRVNALAQSLESIIWWPSEEEQGQDTEALIRSSVAQFASSIEADAAALIAGRISKICKQFPTPPALEVLEAALREEIGALAKAAEATPIAGPTEDTRTQEDDGTMKKNAAQILAGLSAEDRETLQGEIGKGATPPADKPDPLQALPADVRKQLEEGQAVLRKQLEDSQAESAAQRLRIEKMEKEGQRAEFRKTVAFANLATPTDELVEALFEVPVEKRTKLVDTLKAADAAVARVKLYGTPVGSDASSVAGSADAEIQQQAEALQKAQPTLTIEKARVAVLKADPGLYERYEEERAIARAH